MEPDCGEVNTSGTWQGAQEAGRAAAAWWVGRRWCAAAPRLAARGPACSERRPGTHHVQQVQLVAGLQQVGAAGGRRAGGGGRGERL